MKKLIPIHVLLLISGLKVFAQSHLKDVQATSIWAPANVKIDGNVGEWEDHFQAFNKSTKLFYTVSNNDRYLYLALTSTDGGNNTKIAAGGITFTINTAGKKREKEAFSLTYPVVTAGSRGGRGQRGGGRFGGGAQSNGTDTAATNAAHRQFIASSKEIKVLGFKAIDDTLISIYNEYSIKAAIGYDTLGSYNYELAIPLKLLGISPDSTGEIAYNIKVNGLQVSGDFGKVMLDNIQVSGQGGGGGGRAGRGGGRRGGNEKSDNNIDYADLTSPTDFWGKYTLARKQ